jgi:hypothetical protein
VPAGACAAYAWSSATPTGADGDGPEVDLSADAALRLVYGRPVEVGELGGPGAAVLISRL